MPPFPWTVSHASLPRRDFLADAGRALAAGWLATELPWLATLAGCARTGAEPALTVLSAAEGRTLWAVADRILPADGELPGAVEVGAVDFVDRALGTPYFAPSLPVVRAGLAALEARGFATLDEARQIAELRRIDRTPFFAAVRALVVSGVFADPSYGGNRGGGGWRIAGMTHAPSYHAPFGWYDAPNATERAA